ncbi:MAG TPA: hypothetical protein P5572_07070 [Phycisphaerae bacterium]|mgnify:CR=1 FL=1|nr:hypothetical protein [Phycisphaerae bacterium]
MQRFLCVLLLVAGTNICTYAYTRYVTTRVVVTAALDRTKIFLEDEGYYPHDQAGGRVTEKQFVAAKQLLSGLSLAGGLCYWWNDSLPYHGLGILMTATGVLLAFVRISPQAARRNSIG